MADPGANTGAVTTTKAKVSGAVTTLALIGLAYGVDWFAGHNAAPNLEVENSLATLVAAAVLGAVNYFATYTAPRTR